MCKLECLQLLGEKPLDHLGLWVLHHTEEIERGVLVPADKVLILERGDPKVLFVRRPNHLIEGLDRLIQDALLDVDAHGDARGGTIGLQERLELLGHALSDIHGASWISEIVRIKNTHF